jgi:hypothetical protein
VLANTVVPLVVRDPAGAVVYDDNPAVPVTDPDLIASQPAYFASIAAGIGTFTIPNTTGGLELLSRASGFRSGTWTLTLSDLALQCTFEQPAGACCAGGSASSVYDVTVITKQAPGGALPAAGGLDVVIYFATNAAGDGRPGSTSPLSAAEANAGRDTDLNRMRQTLGTLFAGAGITLRSVTYVDLPAGIQSRYAAGVDIDDSGPCSDLAQLFKSAAPGNTLNIFFVRSLIVGDLGSGNEVVGVDGTIPGPATVGGSVGSGAAVATLDLRRTTNAAGSSLCPTGSFDAIRCGPDVTAYIIAHEAGHFLGLYHVTESEGTAFDPLLDTPMCPCLRCASVRSQCASAIPAPSGTPHQMSVAECSSPTSPTTCGGGDNLMFWLLESGSRGVISPEQGRVMRANPLVQ